MSKVGTAIVVNRAAMDSVDDILREIKAKGQGWQYMKKDELARVRQEWINIVCSRVVDALKEMEREEYEERT